MSSCRCADIGQVENDIGVLEQAQESLPAIASAIDEVRAGTGALKNVLEAAAEIPTGGVSDDVFSGKMQASYDATAAAIQTALDTLHGRLEAYRSEDKDYHAYVAYMAQVEADRKAEQEALYE